MFTYPIMGAAASSPAEFIGSEIEVIFATTDLTKTVTLTGVSDVTQCIPFHTSYCPGSSGSYQYAEDVEVDIDLWDDAGTPKATLTRNASASNNLAIRVYLRVVEFNSQIQVTKYHYSDGTMGASPDNKMDKTISAVVVANTFVVHTSSGASGDVVGRAGDFSCRLTSSTNVELKGADGGSVWGGPFTLYVVEDTTGGNWFTVQHEYVDFNTEYLIDITGLTVADWSKTMVVSSVYGGAYFGSYPNSTSSQKSLWTSIKLSDTEWRFHRRVSQGITDNGRCVLQLVEWAKGLSVEHWLQSMSSGQTLVTKTLSRDYDSANTVIASTFINSASISSLDKIAGMYYPLSCCRVRQTGTDEVSIERGYAATHTLAMQIGLQALEFS